MKMVHFNWKRRRGLVYLLSDQHLFFLNMVQIPRYEGTLGEHSYSYTHIKLGTDVYGGWSAEGPGAVPRERNSVPIEWAGHFGEEKNPSSLPGFQLWFVQPVTR